MDPNTQLIVTEIRNLSTRISQLPGKSDVRLAVLEGIAEHEDRCQARQLPPRVAENTGIIRTLRIRARQSFAPVARVSARFPLWLKVVGIIVTAGTALLSALPF